MGFCDLREVVRKLASPFGHTTQVSTQVSTQVQLATTCYYLRVRLARALLRNVYLGGRFSLYMDFPAQILALFQMNTSVEISAN